MRWLTKSPTGFPNRTDTTVSFVDGTMTFSIAPTGSSFKYYIKGTEYTKTITQNVQITDTEGIWYIYFNGDTLTASQTPWEFDDAMVSYLYWDATNDKAIIFADERHGVAMDWATHERLHSVDGMAITRNQLVCSNYTLNSDGSLDAHAQYDFTNGYVYDEDNLFYIQNNSSPSQPFEQKLTPQAWLPLYYQLGSLGTWRKITATAFPVAYDPGNTCKVNQLSGGVGSLVNATNDYYFCIWVFATNNIYEPVIGIVGQNEYIDPLTADENEQYPFLDMTGFPFQEAKLIYRTMFRTSSSYTNTPKAVLNNVVGVGSTNNLASAILNRRLTSTTPFATSSPSDVPITSFSLTPESGTYAVWYNASVRLSANNSLAYTSLWIGGVHYASSERVVQGVGSNFVSTATMLDIVAFNGSEILDVRVRVTSGTFTINDRTLVLVRLGPA